VIAHAIALVVRGRQKAELLTLLRALLPEISIGRRRPRHLPTAASAGGVKTPLPPNMWRGRQRDTLRSPSGCPDVGDVQCERRFAPGVDAAASVSVIQRTTLQQLHAVCELASCWRCGSPLFKINVQLQLIRLDFPRRQRPLVWPGVDSGSSASALPQQRRQLRSKRPSPY